MAVQGNGTDDTKKRFVWLLCSDLWFSTSKQCWPLNGVFYFRFLTLAIIHTDNKVVGLICPGKVILKESVKYQVQDTLFWENMDMKNSPINIQGSVSRCITSTSSRLTWSCSLFFRALMGVVNNISANEVSQLVNVSGVDLILSDLLSRNTEGRLLLFA